MPLMIKLNRNIVRVDLCLDNGHFITVFLATEFTILNCIYVFLKLIFLYIVTLCVSGSNTACYLYR